MRKNGVQARHRRRENAKNEGITAGNRSKSVILGYPVFGYRSQILIFRTDVNLVNEHWATEIEKTLFVQNAIVETLNQKCIHLATGKNTFKCPPSQLSFIQIILLKSICFRVLRNLYGRSRLICSHQRLSGLRTWRSHRTFQYFPFNDFSTSRKMYYKLIV